MIAGTLDIEQQDVLKAVNLYTQALVLLDQYDHQSLEKPEGKIEELELLINRFLVLVPPGPFLLFLNSA